MQPHEKLLASIAKTKLCISKNVHQVSRQRIADMTGFELTGDVGKYLGVPLLHSRATKATYHYLLDNAHNKLSSWKENNLSFAGKATLAQTVLQALPSYTMQIVFLPKGVCHSLEQIIRSFVRTGNNDVRR